MAFKMQHSPASIDILRPGESVHYFVALAQQLIETHSMCSHYAEYPHQVNEHTNTKPYAIWDCPVESSRQSFVYSQLKWWCVLVANVDVIDAVMQASTVLLHSPPQWHSIVYLHPNRISMASHLSARIQFQVMTSAIQVTFLRDLSLCSVAPISRSKIDIFHHENRIVHLYSRRKFIGIVTLPGHMSRVVFARIFRGHFCKHSPEKPY